MMRRQYKEDSSFAMIETSLQLMSCVSTGGTYLRTIHENKIPLIFLALPVMLFVLFGYIKVMRPRDKVSLGMFIGATTGFISGFLSSIVNHDSEVILEIPKISNFERLVYSLEVLHIPVLVGSLVYSLCLVIDRFPNINSLFLAAATSTCVAMTVTVGMTMMDGEEASRSTVAYMCVFFGSLLVAFLLVLVPVIRPSQRVWVFAASTCLLNLYWQSGFLDTLVWDPAFPRFPIPGFLTGMIIIFMLNLVTMRTDMVTKKPQNNCLYGSQAEGGEPRDPMDTLLNACTWHVITFVVQRLSLAMIMLGNTPKDHHMGSDVWLCCLLTIGYLAIITPSFKMDAITKTTIVLAGLIFYVSVTVTNGTLTNGYFIDSIFGLMILFAVQYNQGISPHGVLYC